VSQVACDMPPANGLDEQTCPTSPRPTCEGSIRFFDDKDHEGARAHGNTHVGSHPPHEPCDNPDAGHADLLAAFALPLVEPPPHPGRRKMLDHLAAAGGWYGVGERYGYAVADALFDAVNLSWTDMDAAGAAYRAAWAARGGA